MTYQMCDGGRSNINFISLITSGLLTGKYKRGEKLDSTSGRIAYISNDALEKTEDVVMRHSHQWAQARNRTKTNM
jgi:aryl-alcohol dehydrogenase-like predicted oxidoreductase